MCDREIYEEHLVFWSRGHELQKEGEEVTPNIGFRVLTEEWINAYMHVTDKWGSDLEKRLSIKQWSVQPSLSGKVSKLKHLVYEMCRCNWRQLFS